MIYFLHFLICIQLKRMSRNVKKNKNFLKLILTTERKQALALLDTISLEQVKLLTEIAINLLNLPFPKKLKEIVKKRKRVLQLLSNIKLKTSRKKNIISRHKFQILSTLLGFRHLLMDLL